MKKIGYLIPIVIALTSIQASAQVYSVNGFDRGVDLIHCDDNICDDVWAVTTEVLDPTVGFEDFSDDRSCVCMDTGFGTSGVSFIDGVPFGMVSTSDHRDYTTITNAQVIIALAKDFQYRGQCRNTN